MRFPSSPRYICIFFLVNWWSLAGAQTLDEAQAPFLIAKTSLLVWATLGGKSGWFNLDSGCTVSRVDARTLETIEEKQPVSGGKGSEWLGHLYRIKNLSVGGATVRDVIFSDVAANWNQMMEATAGVKVIGILGYNALRMLSFGIDFGESRAWFWGTGRGWMGREMLFGPGAKLQELEVIDQDGIPRCAVSLNGRPYFAHVDTGSPFFSVPRPASDWLGSDFCAGKSTQTYTPEGQSTARCIVAGAISFGPCKVLAPPLLEDRNSDEPLIVGWCSFLPFHRAYFDFDGGSVAVLKPPDSVNGANVLLGVAAGFEISKQFLEPADPVAKSDEFLPLRSIVSILGISADALKSQSAGSELDHEKAVLELFDKVISPVRFHVLVRSKERLKLVNLRNIQHFPRFSPKTKTVASDVTEPGVYFVRSGQPPQMLKPGRDRIVESGIWRVVAAGGVTVPEIKNMPDDPGAVFLEVPFVHSELNDDDGDDLAARMCGGDGDIQHFDGSAPVCVPKTAIIYNPTEWTPVPFQDSFVIYYPPGWRIPDLSLEATRPRAKATATPPPPRPASSGHYWLYFGNQWIIGCNPN